MTTLIDTLRNDAITRVIWTPSHSTLCTAAADRIEALEAQNKVLRDALTDIENPIAAMQRDVPEGYSFNGAIALSIIERPEHYMSIARKALEQTK